MARHVREGPVGRANVVDSSAWLAYFEGEPTAVEFAPAIKSAEHLVIPSICLLEVFKAVRRERTERDALEVITVMQRGRTVPLDAPLAVEAARVGAAHRLATADSIVYATARRVDGVLWTQDAHFNELADVRYFPKRRSA